MTSQGQKDAEQSSGHQHGCLNPGAEHSSGLRSDSVNILSGSPLRSPGETEGRGRSALVNTPLLTLQQISLPLNTPAAPVPSGHFHRFVSAHRSAASRSVLQVLLLLDETVDRN